MSLESVEQIKVKEKRKTFSIPGTLIPKYILTKQQELSDHELRVSLYLSERTYAFDNLYQVLTVEEIRDGYYKDGKCIIQGTGIHENSIKKAIEGISKKNIFIYFKRAKKWLLDEKIFFFSPSEEFRKIIDLLQKGLIDFYDFQRNFFGKNIEAFYLKLKENNFISKVKTITSKSKKINSKSNNFIANENYLICDTVESELLPEIEPTPNKESINKENILKKTVTELDLNNQCENSEPEILKQFDLILKSAEIEIHETANPVPVFFNKNFSENRRQINVKEIPKPDKEPDNKSIYSSEVKNNLWSDLIKFRKINKQDAKDLIIQFEANGQLDILIENISKTRLLVHSLVKKGFTEGQAINSILKHGYDTVLYCLEIYLPSQKSKITIANDGAYLNSTLESGFKIPEASEKKEEKNIIPTEADRKIYSIQKIWNVSEAYMVTCAGRSGMKVNLTLEEKKIAIIKKINQEGKDLNLPVPERVRNEVSSYIENLKNIPWAGKNYTPEGIEKMIENKIPAEEKREKEFYEALNKSLEFFQIKGDVNQVISAIKGIGNN